VESGARAEHIRKEGDIFHIKAGGRGFSAHSVILATGAGYRKIGVPGESQFLGRGVSYCATCDAMFFRGKKVAVVGGGNTGATEALHLKHVGADVTLVHRRDSLRAEQSLQDALAREGVKLLLSMETKEIVGKESVAGLRLLDKATGKEEIREFVGVFVAVGVDPNTELAKQLSVGLDSEGFIVTDRNMRTDRRMVYAAGDVTGGLRQVITACAGGAVAAMSAYEDLKSPYWA
jgi:thioredoxin reductase (NADPH)